MWQYRISVFTILFALSKLIYSQSQMANSKCLQDLIKGGNFINYQFNICNKIYVVYSVEEPKIVDTCDALQLFDFDIIDCDSSNPIGEGLSCWKDFKLDPEVGYDLCLWRNAIFKKINDSTAEVYYLYSFPCGPNWEYKTLPFIKQTIIFTCEKGYIFSKKVILNLQITEKQFKETMNNYTNLYFKYKENTAINDSILEVFPNFVNKLFSCVMAGNKDAEHLFLSLPSKFPIWIQGIIDEHYYSLYAIYIQGFQSIKNR